MANWNEIKSVLTTKLGGEERTPNMVSVTQVVPPNDNQHTTFVSSNEDQDGRPWISIDAVIGPLSGFDLNRAARLVGDKICGAVATLPVGTDELLVVRHAMPISNINGPTIDDFLHPFYFTTGAASFIAAELSDFNAL